jgi:hypothetical protein
MRHGDMEAWRHGEMEAWRHGDMEAWRHGEMEAWRHGDMEAWRHGDMEAWRHGDMETWRQGGMETWRPGHRDMKTWETWRHEWNGSLLFVRSLMNRLKKGRAHLCLHIYEDDMSPFLPKALHIRWCSKVPHTMPISRRNYLDVTNLLINLMSQT